MVRSLLAVVALLSLQSVAANARSEVTPVQKVIEMLTGMLEKGKKEKKEEQVQYAAYKQFCDDTDTEKSRDISEAEELITVLTADIAKYEAHAAQLTKEIAVHDEDLSVWAGDMKAATQVRKMEKADYDAMLKDYDESIDALQRAIQVLKKQSADVPQKSLIQVANLKSLNLIPEQAKKALDLFLAQGLESQESMAPPEAVGYEFQSSGIIEMLEKLLDKFTDEKTSLEKTEMESLHAYELLMQDLEAQTAETTKIRQEKAEAKAADLEKKATAEGNKAETRRTMDADKKFLADTTATCKTKASDFESRQKLRADEIVALEEAIKILSSSSVSGNADKYLPSFVQQKSSALAQLRSNINAQIQDHVVQLLREAGEHLNSRLLLAVATRAAEDPFVKVKKMIKDLIARLMEEAAAESDHKGWCDTELSTNAQTREEKTAAVSLLQSEADQLEASIAKLSEEISELEKGIASLDTTMAEATTMRTEEKEKNAETIADAKEAQAAVSQALTVLKDFYAKAAEATALVQRRQPEIFDSPYKGLQAENGGVVGMIEVILTDFERLEADTSASETSAQHIYDELMSDSKADKKAKNKSIERKTVKKQDESQALVLKKKDLAGTEKELNAALAYFDKLKPSCIEVGVTYEDRVSRRKEEIESLQQALKILNGEAL